MAEKTRRKFRVVKINTIAVRMVTLKGRFEEDGGEEAEG
jgi:hypothetical protein